MSASFFWYLLLAFLLVMLAFVRASFDKRPLLVGAFRRLGRFEVLVLTFLLAVLVTLGCLQIVLRNFFHTGILWADPMMRHAVLWLGCLGAAKAMSGLRHINIDVFTRLLPEELKPARRILVYTATAIAAFVLGVAALRLVIDERAFGETAFLGMETWMLQAVMPFAFFLIAYRSLVNLFLGREARPMDGTMESMNP